MPHAATASLVAIRFERGADVDALLLHASEVLRSRGRRLGGVIQRVSGDGGDCASSIHVIDLRSGEAFDIWEDRGASAVGCRLNERGLIDAEATVHAALTDGVDLIVINRFGRAESLGRGLIGCFAAAVEAGVPVLTAVRAPYEGAWRAFHGGLGQELPADRGQVTAWALRATAGADARSAEDASGASRRQGSGSGSPETSA